MENILSQTIDNGTIENVHIAPIGDFTGSDGNGNPVKETITQEALQDLADKMNAGDDVLCDVDHQSCKPGTQKDSKAAGWFSNFVVDPIKGLFAKLNLTKWGRELLENREYRYVSPTFLTDEEGMPKDMHSISLTNVPAFKGWISPIINSEAASDDLTQPEEKKDVLIMEKEELKELISTMIKEALNACVEEKKEEAKNDAPPADPPADDPIPESPEEPVQPTPEAQAEEDTPAGDIKKEEVKNEEVKEEEKEEEKKTPEKPEVIKIEALNSAPVIGSDLQSCEWKNLHGEAFFAYLRKHPEVR